MTGILPMGGPEVAEHFNRVRRRAMARMAQACDVNPKKYAERARINVGAYDREDASSWTQMWAQIVLALDPASMLELWNDVSEVIAGGVPGSRIPSWATPSACS